MLKSGVATHFCDSSKLSELEEQLLSIRNPNNVQNILDSFCPADSHEFVLQKNLEQINKCFSAPTIEGILSNLGKDNTEWAQKTIKVGMKFLPKIILLSNSCSEILLSDIANCVSH